MQQQNYIKSLKNVIDILDCFTVDKDSMSVSEISHELGKNKGTISKILSTLAVYNMVVKSELSGKYSIGSKMVHWASLVRVELRTIARPYLQEIKKKTNETASIFVIEGSERICLDVVESTHEIRFGFNVGQKYPIYAGSAGKVLLAYLPKDKRDAVLKKTELIKVGPKTITDREELEHELESIRNQGFSVSFEERASSGASVSAPIRNEKGDVIAALVVGAPSVRMDQLKIEKYVRLLTDTADKISRELGYQPIQHPCNKSIRVSK